MVAEEEEVGAIVYRVVYFDCHVPTLAPMDAGLPVVCGSVFVANGS